MSLTTQHAEFDLKEDGCVGADYREEERSGKRGSQWESNYNPLRLWWSTFISGAFVSPAPLGKGKLIWNALGKSEIQVLLASEKSLLQKVIS